MQRNTRSSRRIWLGRGRELGALAAGLSDLEAGRGSLFLVTGEPGIGKTRLADELAAEAAARGIAPHWGRAWEVGGAPPYWPITQALSSVCRAMSDSELADVVGVHGVELGELLPAVRARLPHSAPPQDRASRDRFLLFEAVGNFLRGAAARAHHLLVLDDLHAADLPSLLLLQFIVRDLHACPVLVLGTYRDAEARLSVETARTLAQIAREATTLPLARLDREEVAAYVAQATGAPAAEDEVDRLHRQTEGNPLFLHELLSLAGRSAVQPAGIREVVRARLALLTPDVRATLEVASVLGRELELATLGALTHATLADTRERIAPAIEAAIIEPIGAARVRFTHVLLREGLYDDLPAARRADLHRAAAEALSHEHIEKPLSEIANHLLAAVPAVPTTMAIDAALAAASRAMDVLAFEDASELLGRAADLLARSGGASGRSSSEAENDAARAFDVALALGVARIRSGDVDAGKRSCRRAVSMARALGDPQRFARAVLGCAYEYTPGVRDAELVAMLEEALVMLPSQDGALRARCMAQLAAERQFEPDTSAASALARDAIAIARRLGESETLRFTLTAAGLAMLLAADPDERIAVDQESLRLATAAGDKRLALRAHLLLVSAHGEKGDLDRVRANLRAYTSLARELGHPAFDWTRLVIMATLALVDGRFAEAESIFRDAREMSLTDAARGASMAAFPASVCCMMERYEALAEIEMRVREGFASAEAGLGGCLAEMLVARLHARAGDRERTASQLARVRADPVFASITEGAWLGLLAEPCQLLGDQTLAERLTRALAPRASRFFSLAYLGPGFEPPYSRQLGLAAEALGRVAEAVVHFEDAEARTTRIGMRGALARVRYELARALLRRNADGDAARARHLLADARALATELGQTGLLPFIGALEERREAPTASSSRARPVDAADALDVSITICREGDFWTVARGTRAIRLRDSRGLQVLARLLETPEQEHHVLMLVSTGGDARAGDGSRGDAGEHLDRDAIGDYRQRLLDLRDEIDEAETLGDRGRCERAQTEIDFLTQELARAVGLGGRARRAGLDAERARTTVQKRVREAIRRIHDELPEVGLHLEQSVRTGAFCGYFPRGRPRRRPV